MASRDQIRARQRLGRSAGPKVEGSCCKARPFDLDPSTLRSFPLPLALCPFALCPLPLLAHARASTSCHMRSRSRRSSVSVRSPAGVGLKHRVRVRRASPSAGQSTSAGGLSLEPLERRVHGANGNRPLQVLFEPLHDRHRVGIVAQRPHRQQHELLELAQMVALHSSLYSKYVRLCIGNHKSQLTKFRGPATMRARMLRPRAWFGPIALVCRRRGLRDCTI